MLTRDSRWFLAPGGSEYRAHHVCGQPQPSLRRLDLFLLLSTPWMASRTSAPTAGDGRSQCACAFDTADRYCCIGSHRSSSSPRSPSAATVSCRATDSRHHGTRPTLYACAEAETPAKFERLREEETKLPLKRRPTDWDAHCRSRQPGAIYSCSWIPVWRRSIWIFGSDKQIQGRSHGTLDTWHMGKLNIL